jgi:hypothetical protein
VVLPAGGALPVSATGPTFWFGCHFGVDHPDTLKDFGQANQFEQTQLCGGGFGTDSTYCDTLLK